MDDVEVALDEEYDFVIVSDLEEGFNLDHNFLKEYDIEIINCPSKEEEHIEKKMLEANSYYLQGKINKEENNLELMEENFIKAMNLGSVEALISLGNYYEELEDNEKAKEFYIKGIENNDSKCYFYIALLCKKDKNIDDMIKYFNLSLLNGNYYSYFYLLDYYKNNNNDEKCLEIYLLLLENDKNNTYLLFLIGLLYKKIKNYKKMIDYFKMIMNLSCLTYYYKAANEIGNYYFHRNNYKMAKNMYLNGIKFSYNIQGLINLGLVYKKLNEIESNENVEENKYYIYNNLQDIEDDIDFEIDLEEEVIELSGKSNFECMIYYFKQARDLGSSESLYELGLCYKSTDDMMMVKYFEEGVQFNNKDCIKELMNYYVKDEELHCYYKNLYFNCVYEVENENEIDDEDFSMIELLRSSKFLSEIDNGSLFYYLGLLYEKIDDKLMIKCYEDGSQHDNFNCTKKLLNYYKNNQDELFLYYNNLYLAQKQSYLYSLY